MKVLLVLTNLPDRPSADSLAAGIVERRLAACVNMLSPCQSVYCWKGAVERAGYAHMALSLGSLNLIGGVLERSRNLVLQGAA